MVGGLLLWAPMPATLDAGLPWGLALVTGGIPAWEPEAPPEGPPGPSGPGARDFSITFIINSLTVILGGASTPAGGASALGPVGT